MSDFYMQKITVNGSQKVVKKFKQYFRNYCQDNHQSILKPKKDLLQNDTADKKQEVLSDYSLQLKCCENLKNGFYNVAKNFGTDEFTKISLKFPELTITVYSVCEYNPTDVAEFKVKNGEILFSKNKSFLEAALNLDEIKNIMEKTEDLVDFYNNLDAQTVLTTEKNKIVMYPMSVYMQNKKRLKSERLKELEQIKTNFTKNHTFPLFSIEL